MAPLSRDRSILRILSIALLLILSYLIFSCTSAPVPDIKSACNTIFVIVLSFNIVILLAWIGFGVFGGIALSILSFLAAGSGALRSGNNSAVFICLGLIPVMLAGYRHWRATERIEYTFELESEKLEEDINILSADLQKKKAEISHLEGRLLRYLVLKDVAEVLATTLVLEDIARLIIEKTADTMRKEGNIFLYLVDTDKQELMLCASRPAVRIKAKKGDIFDQWVLKHALPLIVEDAAKDFRFSSAHAEGGRAHAGSLIIVPLLNGNKVIGILRMDSDRADFFTQDDLRLLDITGGLSALAAQNAFLYSRIQDLAIRDSLTGLFVRRHFLKRFQEEIGRAGGKGKELSLLILDIDRFKWYNDKYGHAMGDLVLKHITSRIAGMLRAGDMAARYGGEEIAILLQGADKKNAKERAEAIRKEVEQNPLVMRREKHDVTVSVGVSGYPRDSTFEEELIKIADERLYKAKSLGRNMVCAD